LEFISSKDFKRLKITYCTRFLKNEGKEGKDSLFQRWLPVGKEAEGKGE
jgi:hypothetical protein